MSKINDLIKKLCPNGVIYKNLEDVCNISKGKQLNKEQLSEIGEYPVMNGGISPSGYWQDYNFNANKITISQGGASAGYINYLTSKFWLVLIAMLLIVVIRIFFINIYIIF